MGELPFIPPKEVSRQEMLDIVPGHIRESPLFLESIGIAEKAHEFQRRESGYPVLEGHIFQSVFLLAKLSQMLKLDVPAFVYSSQLLHDSLEDTSPDKLPRGRRKEARARHKEVLADIAALSRFEDGGLVLPFVRTLTRPSERRFSAARRVSAKEIRDRYYETVLLVGGHKSVKPEVMEKIGHWIPLVKGSDSGSNLFSPILTPEAKRRLLYKAEYYNELLAAYPQAQDLHSEWITWARRQPPARARTWINREDRDKPLPARRVDVLPSGLTVVRGAYSTALLWANTGGDLSRYLLENINIRKAFLRSRPRKDMLAFRGNVIAHVGFGPEKQVVVYKPRRHKADPVMEAIVLHEFQKIIRRTPGLRGRFAAETPFGIVVDHTKRRPELHLLVEPAPEGSDYRGISEATFKSVADHLRQAGFRWGPKSFHYERNVLSLRGAHTLVGVDFIRHVDKAGFVSRKQSEMPWVKDLQRLVAEYRRKRLSQVGIGESSGLMEP
ncbi:MAG: hypothetical protein V1787_01965 [Candidatus Micrarchaeota archaeon]